MNATPSKELILASSSATRRTLLKRLGIPFRSISPDIDESPQGDEAPEALVLRLAREKAEKIADAHGLAWVIGSDQVAALDGRALGKPADLDEAFAQLRAMGGRTVHWFNGLCLLNRHIGQPRMRSSKVEVAFRPLSDIEIRRYLEKDNVLDCAGSFRSESLGSALVTRISSDDPDALLGLPLIGLCSLLREAGFDLP